MGKKDSFEEEWNARKKEVGERWRKLINPDIEPTPEKKDQTPGPTQKKQKKK